ncbi:hypothetical protein IMG5_040260 [Ichthyophthirius multifiliis]|uniref:Transmembrane protein n=1 Tax=Ichthyophthirius multifiliis TaxID=5932 RepID=G0QM02_ICHMU|nr:hypothetical protein IMG5_040260 [Ichthyophthirius multifiliis]EGR33752.1 hypothetical protein IMG5_040260 [Ichthyophthirius multifiliis]|eukprot:XP_004038976.1 hypothetical protein IMG5_040260 [Ichthyophthirius multifiliis]
MSDIQQFFNKNKKVIFVTAAASFAALGAYYFFNKIQSENKVQKNQQTNQLQRNSITGFQDEEQYKLKARQISQKIAVKKIGNSNFYDMNTISQVLEYSIELAGDEYVQETLNNRESRRKLMKTDGEQYEKLILQYNDNVENILRKAQSCILEELNISCDDFEESVIAFMEQGHYQEIYMFQAAIRQKIKEKIASQKNLTVDRIKEIIKFQIELLKQQPQLLKNSINKLSSNNETVQLIPTIISTMLHDYIHEQFKVEEEDQMKVMTRTEMTNDHEIILLLQEIEQEMYKLMMPFGQGGI